MTDFSQKINGLKGRVGSCRNPSEAGTTLVQGISELIQEATKGDAEDVRDLGAALASNAQNLGSQLGEIAEKAGQRAGT